MEPAQEPVRLVYSVYTTVLKVEEQFRSVYQSGYGSGAIFAAETKGWFMHLNGSYEAIHMGFEEPKFKQGDKIRVTFERIEDAKPSQPPVK